MTALPAAGPAPAPETLQGRRAGLVSRLEAAGIDVLVMVLGVATLYGAVAGLAFLLDPRSFSWPHDLGWSVPAVAGVVGVPYLGISWSASGRTLGNVLLGLRVVRRNGRRLGLLRALGRAVLCLAVPIGLLWIPFDRSRRSLQDLVTGTVVSYDWLPAHRT